MKKNKLENNIIPEKPNVGDIFLIEYWYKDNSEPKINTKCFNIILECSNINDIKVFEVFKGSVQYVDSTYWSRSEHKVHFYIPNEESSENK